MTDTSPKRLFNRPFSRRWIETIGGEFRKLAADNEITLEIKRRARENGRNNLPVEDDVEPDLTQRQILDTFSSGAESLSQALWNTLRGALEQIVDRIPRELDTATVVSRLRNEIERTKDRFREELIGLRHDEREAWRDLKLFKGENELARSATYPRSRPPTLVLAAIGGALLVESFLNGMIFREVSPSYTVGGIVQALAFSVVNVALGYFVLGFAAARYAGHRTPWKRQLGWSGLSFAILLGLLWNLYVAHYREAAEVKFALFQATHNLADFTNNPVDGIAHMLAGFWNIPSWPALVLFIVGLLIFFALGVEGFYGWDDVYPGYGPADRKHKDARLAYEAGARDLRNGVNGALGRVAAEMDARIERDKAAVIEAREIASEAEQAVREANDSVAELGRACIQNLKSYREANIYVCTTRAPRYFDTYPTLAIRLERDPEIDEKLALAKAALAGNLQRKEEFDKSLAGLTDWASSDLAAYFEDILEKATFLADHERKPGASPGSAGSSPPPRDPDEPS
ncbi:MAG TPA: hypothetical protein VMH86_17175 [Rhizomicrobium sp.]|nr:hypothetical protein [Rhizomicrobium sp.]